ncbi:hypothetical protein IWQ61_003853 [Dispira simplex]|nr:hypothetical protein IWQ61_003853 [Dispira simplex]
MADQDPTLEYYGKYSPSNDRSPLDRWARSPYLSWANALACLASAQMAIRQVPGFPAPVYSLGFAAAFGLAGYVTHQRDYENGAGSATAWSLTWLALNTSRAWRTKQWQALTVLGIVGSTGFVYGRRYFNL